VGHFRFYAGALPPYLPVQNLTNLLLIRKIMAMQYQDS